MRAVLGQISLSPLCRSHSRNSQILLSADCQECGSRASVRVCVEKALDQLPGVYTPDRYARKCNLDYQHVYDSYFGEGHSIHTVCA